MIDAKLIAQLREKTGAGIVDVKAALDETNGDMTAAEELLRKKGILKAGKKSDRVAGEGIVYSYIHGGGKVGVMLELRCETDFVARTDGFVQLAHDIALHIAAMNPLYLDEASVPAELVEKEREIYKAELAESKKPEEIMAKILDGKIQKYYSDICLLKQAFIKDESMTVEDVIKHGISKMGENIQMKRFVRYHLGQE